MADYDSYLDSHPANPANWEDPHREWYTVTKNNDGTEWEFDNHDDAIAAAKTRAEADKEDVFHIHFHQQWEYDGDTQKMYYTCFLWNEDDLKVVEGE